MVISADGHFEDTTGSSRGLSSPLDLKVLLTLRALSDAILVGATTIRKENYQTPKLRGEFTQLNTVAPKLVILSRTLEFDLTTRLFTNPENKPIFVSSPQDDTYWQLNYQQLSKLANVILVDKYFSLTEVVTHLRNLGMQKITSEGGLKTLVELMQEDLVDELDITMSPISLGHPAARTVVHDAINTWPNRVSAKIGQHRIWRIKR